MSGPSPRQLAIGAGSPSRLDQVASLRARTARTAAVLRVICSEVCLGAAETWGWPSRVAEAADPGRIAIVASESVRPRPSCTDGAKEAPGGAPDLARRARGEPRPSRNRECGGVPVTGTCTGVQ